ncbi:hypothetical protein [Streptomyces sp. ISL-100]|uniref:hypothetical protein n=1 Tax=Streptomyces sp. ISL-100 TaxID=2819173 RepID=UPI001BEA8AF0|nr:hypothetical protein [Streptomyces sp. ISL-100]MBT2400374.1 hypothetical protein [Streptomyces sp. ISL-100]
MVGVPRRMPSAAVRTRERSQPWTYSTPMVCAAAFIGSACLLPMLGVVGGLHHPAAALAAYCTLSLAVGLRAHPRAVPLAAAVCWLFYDGFIVHQQGELAWDGCTDVSRMGLLAGAFLLGTTIARASNALRV